MKYFRLGVVRKDYFMLLTSSHKTDNKTAANSLKKIVIKVYKKNNLHMDTRCNYVSKVKRNPDAPPI